ncbi:kinase-like domain-containing protein [Rhizophagus diaphanus]|nr:kinase-like domain-containing protein [Rhizophagus diaphanus] [Rhizophagus sp. MUCL 43196]
MELKLINHDISAIKNNIKCFKSSDLFIHLSTHSKYEAIFRRKLEWIPYNEFCDVKYIVEDVFKKTYRAKWINKRNSVFLESLDDPNNVTPEFVTRIIVLLREIYGITQVPKTKTFMLVLNEICEKCNIMCNAMHYHQNFKNWTSGNNDIDKYIQNTQLLAHVGYKNSLEWIPYDRFYDFKHVAEDKFGKSYKANWTDGNIKYWYSNNWIRENPNMLVFLKSLKNLKDITLELNEITVPYKFYGITQDPKTNTYMAVLSETCENCNSICNAIHFQQNFENWTSGNKNIDKLIQDTQLSVHNKYASVIKKILEWVPYNRLYNIKYISESNYKANWIDGYIDKWDHHNNKTWKRKEQNLIVFLKSLDNPNSITPEYINEISKHYEVYGITQDPETKNYMMIYNEVCGKCKYVCSAIHFKRNFKNWTSGNINVDKFIQDIQLSVHKDANIRNVLEWIPYDKFNNIKYIGKGGFANVYRAEWTINGQHNKLVALKSLNNSKNITLEFMNEIALHNKIGNSFSIIDFHGITQDPITKNYMMVLEYAKEGSLRNYLDKYYNKLSWDDKLLHLYYIASGLVSIHKNGLVHRDFHISNILVSNYTKITDMGLCKPVNCDATENTKKCIYGVLPYIAPEILQGQNYTKAADIYSFGIIMYEVISGLPPYHDVSHDKNLAIKICQGLRPKFNIKLA